MREDHPFVVRADFRQRDERFLRALGRAHVELAPKATAKPVEPPPVAKAAVPIPRPPRAEIKRRAYAIMRAWGSLGTAAQSVGMLSDDLNMVLNSMLGDRG